MAEILSRRMQTGRTGRLLLLAALTSAAALPVRAEPVTFTPVALSGSAAPGADGTRFETFSHPKLNAQGDLVFSATLTGASQPVSAENKDGIWLARSGQPPQLVARTSGAAPLFGSGLAAFQSLGLPHLDGLGNVGFRADLRTGNGVTASNNQGLWITGTAPTELWLAIREGAKAVIAADGSVSGTTEGYFEVFSNPSLSGTGALTFSAELRGGTFETRSGLWQLPRPSSAPGASTRPSLVALSGTAAPGLEGVTFEDFSVPDWGGAGEAFFRSTLTGSSISGTNQQALWAGPTERFALLVRAGQYAPDTSILLHGLSRPASNNLNQVAFTGELLNSERSEGVWLRANGATRLLSLAGTQAPGWATPLPLASYLDPVISDAGTAGFLAYIDEDVNSHGIQPHGIWTGNQSSALQARARTGDQAPGTAAGTVFASLSSPRMNGRGQIAFPAYLSNGTGNLSASSDFGVWASDINGFLLPVVREGDAFTVGAGDVRIVESAQISEFSDSGKLALALEFTNGTAGLFLADVHLAKVGGGGLEVGPNIAHPNGNRYDQILLTGTSATITADAGQVTRLSFVDLSDDIVQIEFSGKGTLTLSLENASGPAAPLKYNQPSVQYMKGHASIVINDPDATTNVSVFSVGKSNAVNTALFREGTEYDGLADISSLTITGAGPQVVIGAIRTANAVYSNTSGVTGIHAPNVTVQGPVYVGDIHAFDTATPTLVFASATEVLIAGGTLRQDNGKAVQANGVAHVTLGEGSTSHGVLLPARAIEGRLEQNGVDVTSQLTGP